MYKFSFFKIKILNCFVHSCILFKKESKFSLRTAEPELVRPRMLKMSSAHSNTRCLQRRHLGGVFFSFVYLDITVCTCINEMDVCIGKSTHVIAAIKYKTDIYLQSVSARTLIVTHDSTNHKQTFAFNHSINQSFLEKKNPKVSNQVSKS